MPLSIAGTISTSEQKFVSLEVQGQGSHDGRQPASTSTVWAVGVVRGDTPASFNQSNKDSLVTTLAS